MAIAFDSRTLSALSSVGSTSVTFSHTCTGSERFLIVTCTTLNWTAGAPANITATYGGVAMTLVAKNIQVYNINNWRTHQFYLVNPPSGANNAVVTTTSGSGRMGGGAFAYTGVDQVSPVIASNTISSPVTGNTMAISLTTAEDAWWFISGSNVDGIWSGGANTPTVRDSSAGVPGGADSNGIISAQTGNAQMSHAGSRGYGGIAIAFKPAGGAFTKPNYLGFSRL